MPDEPDAAPDPPETTAVLLGTFADLYRHEVSAVEDVHRTLPFFGTSLGIVIAAVAYAAGRLPRWPDIATPTGRATFFVAFALLALSALEAGCVLLWIYRAIGPGDYQRVGPEAALRASLTSLREYYDARDVHGGDRDQQALGDMRRLLLDSYTAATPVIRVLNNRRHRLRALAASHLVRSLIWALAATTVIFAADKLGIFARAFP